MQDAFLHSNTAGLDGMKLNTFKTYTGVKRIVCPKLTHSLLTQAIPMQCYFLSPRKHKSEIAF